LLRGSTTGAALLAALAVAACAHYTPAPPQPERYVAAFEARRLSPAPPDHAWSGAELLAAALAANPAVSEAHAKYQAALAQARASRMPPAMGLTLIGEYAREHPRWGRSAIGDIPLDLGARRDARLSTADLQALQALYDWQDAAWTVRNDLAKARADLADADQELALAGEAALLRAERVQRVARRVSAGEDDRPPQLAARSDELAAERRLADARARQAQARSALAKALGAPVAAVADLRVAAPADPPSLAEAPSWGRAAALQRSDVLRAVADYDIAENALRVEVAKQYPEIRLSPGYNWDHGVLKLPFGLAMVLPPADLNRSAIRQAEASRAAAGRALETVQANVLAGVDQALAAAVAAAASENQVQVADVPTARLVAVAAKRSEDAGEGDRIDALAAQAAADDAQLNLIDARRTARAADADLEFALRRIFDPAEAAVLQAQMETK
jgi:CRISPR system Cascade subunit CasA